MKADGTGPQPSGRMTSARPVPDLGQPALAHRSGPFGPRQASSLHEGPPATIAKGGENDPRSDLCVSAEPLRGLFWCAFRCDGIDA